MHWNEGLYRFIRQEGGAFIGSVLSEEADGVGLLDYRGRQLVICGYRAAAMGRYQPELNTRALLTAELNGTYHMSAQRKNIVVNRLMGLLGKQTATGDEEFDRQVVVKSDNERFTRLVFQSQPLKDALLEQKGVSVAVEPVEEESRVHLIEVRTAQIPTDWYDLQGESRGEPYAELERNGVEMFRRLAGAAKAAYDAVTEWRM